MNKPDTGKRVLVINPFGIGDVLFTTPVINAIKDAYPQSHIGYWCNERVASLFKHNAAVNEVFALSRGDLKRIYRQSPLKAIVSCLRLIRDLKRARFELCFDFSLDHRYGLWTKLLGIPVRIGLDYKNRGRFLTQSIKIDGYEGKHVVDYYLEALALAGITPRSRHLSLTVPADNRIKNSIQLASGGVREKDILVGIAPGAGESWGKNARFKHWPVIRFTQLADRITEELGAKIVIVGSPAERSIADAIIYAMKHKPVDLVGKTSLEELIATLSNLDLLIANDGGPLHMAVALGIKTVSIFGPVDETVYGPYPPSPKHRVITGAVECRPCYRKFRIMDCDKDRECITTITTEQVFEGVKALL